MNSGVGGKEALTPLSITHVPPGEYVIQVNTAFGKERSAATGRQKDNKGIEAGVWDGPICI